MNTKENNKLIAEFMGYESYDYRGYRMFILEENNHRTDVDLHYHTSWDWLKPVVDKIEEVYEGVPDELMNVSLFSEIGEVYNGVIEFIKRTQQ